jgi:hypothetical protein
MQLISGRIFAFVFMLMSFAIFYAFMRRAMKGKVRKMRPLAGLQAIPESIGKAAETNRPVHYTPGTVGFSGGVAGNASQTFAGLSVLSHVAKLTAKYKVPLYVTVAYGELIPVVESVVRESYTSENRADAVSSETHVIFFPIAISNAPYASGVLGLFERIKPAANIMIGAFYFEALAISEQGFVQGAIQIAGTAMTAQIAFFVAACDYTLIGEEIFVAGAVVSQDATLLGCITGQDLLKAIVFAMLVGGFILQNLGVDLLRIMSV